MATTQIVTTVYYVGQGMCNLVEVFDGATLTHLLLADFGSKHDELDGRATTLSDLKKKIIAHGVIDILVVSHSDDDHWNVLGDLLKELNKSKVQAWIGRTIIGMSKWDIDANGTKREIQDILKKASKLWTWIESAYTDIRPSGNLNVYATLGNMEVIIPVAAVIAADVVGRRSKKVESNTTSIVVQCRLNNYYFLFTADATSVTFEYMNERLNGYMLGRGNGILMTAPHHGAWATLKKLPILERFTNSVKPQYTIASAGFNDGYKHPNACIMAAMSGFVGLVANHTCVINFANTKSCEDNSVYKRLYAGRGSNRADWYNVHTDLAIYTTLATLDTYNVFQCRIAATAIFPAAIEGMPPCAWQFTKIDSGAADLLPIYTAEETEFYVGTPPPKTVGEYDNGASLPHLQRTRPVALNH